MDISDIPDSPVPSIAASRDSPKRRERDEPEEPLNAKEDRGPDPRSRAREPSVELLLSEKARSYQVLRDVAERALRGQSADDLAMDRANARLDEWNDWTPEGAAHAMFRELRLQTPGGLGTSTDAIRGVRCAFRDEQDAIQRAGLGCESVESYLRETLIFLVAALSSDSAAIRTPIPKQLEEPRLRNEEPDQQSPGGTLS